MSQIFSRRIISLVKKSKKQGISHKELLKCCHVRPKKHRDFLHSLKLLQKKNIVYEVNSRLYCSDFLPAREAVITRLNSTFGFAKYTDNGTEVFIPGKYFMGAMPGDTVLVTPIEPRGDGPEGAVIKILKEGISTFTGTLLLNENGYFLKPDSMIRYNLPISEGNIENAVSGDKVLCSIVKRGENHSRHIVKIIKSFGDAQTAVNCAESILQSSGVSLSFPDDVNAQAEHLNAQGISSSDLKNRLDLRNELIFTIDSASSKDLDDAVSIKKIGNNYELGVHIADVSHYVTHGSALNTEAFKRGTSIYFADRVIPMLPKALSNGICSLNPGEDRLAFSCIMTISKTGILKDYKFHKSVIRSAVKGVYKEINSILSHTQTEEINNKYASLIESIFLMKELSDILTNLKQSRGSLEIETSESHILLNENSTAVNVVPRERGESELIIENFMLLANEAAATLAKDKGLPFVYRVHEPPAEEKLETLRTVLSALGINTSKITSDVSPLILSQLLNESKGKPSYPIINMNVLRAMSKARYYEQPIGHYGLALKNYTHFTSPIRRYPDLTIHRILNEYIKGTPIPKIVTRYSKFTAKSSKHSSSAELTAMQLERSCDDCYKAEYMKNHIGEEFSGIISSVAPHGIYVELANTVEGLIKTESLPNGNYNLDSMIQYKNLLTGKAYRIGDSIKVKCTGADVSAGNIDFIPA